MWFFLTGTTHILMTSSGMVVDAHAIFLAQSVDFFFTTLTASCYWFFAFWLVCMHSCWVISLAHIANFSLRAVSSTKVLTYWFIATKAKILLPAKLSSVSNFHLLCSKHQCHQFLASRTSWLHLLQLFLSIG